MEQDEMLPEYDFTGKKGERGKYYPDCQQGHTVRIYEEDGSVTVQYFTLEEGAVMLAPDVRAYFPDSESVNRALRALIAIAPKKPVENMT
jgi:hypothetical protein